MSEIQPPTEVLQTIEEERARCPFVFKGKLGCLLKFNPEITEVDQDGVYFHATCGKKWEQDSFDVETDELETEIEQCYAHPVIDQTGDIIADWG